MDDAQLFINQTVASLDDESQFNRYVGAAIEKLEAFISQPRDILKKKLEAKLQKARREHPNPSLSTANIEVELEEELLDFVFGWPSVANWPKKKEVIDSWLKR